MKPNVLFVDDEKDIVFTFERTFRNQYNIYTSSSPEKALEMLPSLPEISVIISDFNMPKMNGVEFLSKTINISPESMRIMLTGFADMNTILDAINENKIYKFLLKPTPTEVLKSQIDEAVHTYILKTHEKEILRLKSVFLSVVSRNFKHPLTGILTSTYLLPEFIKQNKTSDFEQCLKNIQDSVSEMSNQIDKIMIMTELDNDYKTSKSIIDINSYILDLISCINFKNKKKIEIDFKNETDIETIESDIRLVNLILENVLDNSEKNTPAGGTIDVHTIKSNGNIRITVSDTGCGIPEGELDFILNPFSKTSVSKDYSGSGLGLTIVKKAVELLGGSVKINSQKGAGTKVEISLPIK